LPADGGITLEQPINHVHRRRLTLVTGGRC
jgi:hypothetical protein